jgi:hypothetical protein
VGLGLVGLFCERGAKGEDSESTVR